jgi:hypothetical protein
MGVQGIIWDCRSWWGHGEGLGKYSVCYDKKGRRKKRVNKTLAHRDHIHFEMSRTGARKSTSFWTRKAPKTRYQPEPEQDTQTDSEPDADSDEFWDWDDE